MIVAWHEVPGKSVHRENRPVGYGMIRSRAHACRNQTVPYGTALLGGAVPGTSCQATIAPSLRDKSHRPAKGSH